MKNFARIFWVITLMLIIGFSMTSCDDDSGSGDGGSGGDNGGVSLPQSSGTNEVLGKTLYLSDWQKIVFAATGTTFKSYYTDYYDEDELENEDSYSYNSDNHTITLAIEYVYWGDKKMNKTQAKNEAGKQIDAQIAWLRANFDEVVLEMAVEELELDWRDDYYNAGEPDDEYTFLKQWLTQKGYNSTTLISQWKSRNPSMNTADKYINAMLAMQGYKNLAEYKAYSISYYVDEMFAPTTYDYQFTTDNSLLVQEKLPANKGSNELQGKSFTTGYSAGSYTFAANGTYTATGGYYSSGTYAYNSNTKKVWLRPEKIDGKTILEYYSSSWGGNSDEKAMDTNDQFRVHGTPYGLNPNLIW